MHIDNVIFLSLSKFAYTKFYVGPYIQAHPFDSGDSSCETVLDQLYQAYAESHESDPPEISEGFKELEEFLETLPLDDNNAVFTLCCRLCTAYEKKAFRHGLLYGAHLMQELDIS